MAEKKLLVLFDMDGTLTYRDTMIEFIRFVRGSRRLFMSYLANIVTILLFKTGLVDAQKAKEKLLAFHFAGMTKEDLMRHGKRFGKDKIPGILRGDALKSIAEFREKDAEIVILSASLDIWLHDWAREMGFRCICSIAEWENGLFAGRIRGKNCKGEEKVRRLKEELNLSDYSEILAYGDSKSDFSVYEIADRYFHKAFR